MAIYKIVATIETTVEASDETEAEEIGVESLCWSNADITVEESDDE
jgi:hypothetical protein|tara:strand:+ start:305 stop:442 length:138 start_codon:yes stop_codon:yes gene_type:complete